MDKAEYDKLILDHLDIVKIIALKISARLPAGVELDDLIHSGIIGLIDAVKKYDASKGTKFSTYASLRIRGAILDELRNLDWASRNLRQKIKEMEKVYADLEHELGRPPESQEVADSMNITIEELHRLLDESKGVGIGVFRYAGDDEGNISDDKQLKYFSSESENSPVLTLEKKDLQRVVAEFIDELPERERMVLSLYYIEDLNLKEIGKIMGLTESRISQIRTAAIVRIRGKIARMAADNLVDEGSLI